MADINGTLLDQSYPSTSGDVSIPTEALYQPLKNRAYVEIKVYTMRGWDSTLGVWEFWSSRWRPLRSPFPYPLTHVTIVKVSTEQVVM